MNGVSMSSPTDTIIQLLLTPELQSAQSINKLQSILHDTPSYVLSSSIYPILPYILDRLFVDSIKYGLSWIKSTEFAVQLLSTNGALFKLIFDVELGTLAPLYTISITVLPLHIQKLIKTNQLQFYSNKYKTTQTLLPNTINVTSTLTSLSNTKSSTTTSSIVRDSTSYIPPTTATSPTAELLELTIQQYYLLRFALFCVHNLPRTILNNGLSNTSLVSGSAIGSFTLSSIKPSNVLNSAGKSSNSEIDIERRACSRYRLLLEQYLYYILPHRVHHSNVNALNNSFVNAPSQLLNSTARAIKSTAAQPMFGTNISKHLHNHSATSNEAIQLAVSMLTIVSDTWLAQNVYVPLSYAQNRLTQQNIFTTPTSAVLQSVHDTVVHILRDFDADYTYTDVLSTTIKQHRSQYIPTAQLGSEIFGRALYRFIYSCYTEWPQHRTDSKLVSLINIHHDWLQPWLAVSDHITQISSTHQPLASNAISKDTVVGKLGAAVIGVAESIEHQTDHLTHQHLIQHRHMYSNTWRQYVVDNYVFYSILFRSLLQLVVTIQYAFDESSQRVSQLQTILDILKIYDGSLLELLRELEIALLRQQRSAFIQRDSSQTVTQQAINDAQFISKRLFYISDITVDQYHPVFTSINTSTTSATTQQQSTVQLAINALNVLNVEVNKQNEINVYQQIEKRVKHIFHLNDIPLSDLGRQLRSKRQQSLSHEQMMKYSDQPVISLHDRLAPDTINDGYVKLSAAGRREIALGKKLCTRSDIPYIGNELYRPAKPNEITIILHICIHISQLINNFFHLPNQPNGAKVSLRIFAHKYVVLMMSIAVAILMKQIINLFI